MTFALACRFTRSLCIYQYPSFRLCNSNKILLPEPSHKAEYEISEYCGLSIRNVKPYVHTFHTFCKGRWLGRELIEILSREFGGQPLSYWENAIANGHVMINDEVITQNYIMKNSDRLVHKTHRHEPPVFGCISFIGCVIFIIGDAVNRLLLQDNNKDNNRYFFI